MPSLDVICPYCGQTIKVLHDGSFASRYHDCQSCQQRFVYEPLASRVQSYKLEEARGWIDPDTREIDASGHDEQ
jgi:transposase-like protein